MLLRIENLTFAWLNDILFDNISINVDNGEIIILKGENGCGKSTFLQIIAGMIPHFNRGRILMGDVLIKEKSIIRSAPRTFFPEIAYLPEKNIELFLFTENLNEEILLLQAILNLEIRHLEDRKNNFIKFFPELENFQKLPFYLMKVSQKKLILLLIYFLQDAKLFLLDEIFKSFTPDESCQFINFVMAGRQAGKTFLLVNHQEIEPFKTWELKNKKIVQK